MSPARRASSTDRLSACLLLGAALQAPLAAIAAEANVDRQGNQLYVTAAVDGPSGASDCYAVLTDFERLPDFVPGMRSSRVVSQPGEMLKVEQVGSTGPSMFALTIRTTLGLTLTPPSPGLAGRIDFGAFGGNLRQMYGSWVVRESATGCRIEYRATIEPDFPVPPLIGPLMMRRQVEDQLDAVSREIGRRLRSRETDTPTVVATPLD